MAAYTEYNPGPTIAEQHDTLDELLDAFWTKATPEFTGVIGASAELTWYLTGANQTGGANPSINLLWASTAGGHTATTFVRFDAALNGMLDPAYTWLVRADIFSFLTSYNYATINTWRTRVGGTVPWNGSTISGLLSGWLPGLTGGGDTTGTGPTALAYTDGARAGGIAASRLVYAYNPTAGELTAGVKQVAAAHVCAFTDSADGTINIAGLGSPLGEAVRNVPVPQVATPQAEASWLGLETSQLLNKKNVTNASDLGEAGGSDEPAPGDAVPVFINENYIEVLVDTPAAWTGLTTVASMLTGLLATAGHFLATAASVGIIAAVKAAADALAGIGSLLGAVTTAISGTSANVATVTSAIGSSNTALAEIRDKVNLAATNISGVSSAVGGVSTAIDGLKTGGPSNDLISTLGSQVTATTGVGTAIAGTTGQLTPAIPGTFAAEVIARLERIADAQEAQAANMTSLRDALVMVAETRTYVHVKTHGHEWEAESGALIEE